MRFSDIQKVLSDAQIIGNLDKKKIISITDHSKLANSNTLLVYDKNKNFVEKLIGDATLSKWCQEFLDVNPEQSSWRENAKLFEEEKRFWKPTGIETNDEMIFISDSCRHRVQIYKNN